MDKEIDKELNELVGKLLQETPLESPALNFTSKIMAQVETLPKNELFIYRPLISKNVWVSIGLILFMGSLLVVFGNVEIRTSLMDVMTIAKRPSFELFANLSQFDMPNAFVYGVLGFSFFACIQIVMIKRRHDKRFIVH